MDHFMNFSSYGNDTCETTWNAIFENDTYEQKKIAIKIKRRHLIRKLKIDEAGLPLHNLAPMLQ